MHLKKIKGHMLPHALIMEIRGFCVCFFVEKLTMPPVTLKKTPRRQSAECHRRLDQDLSA